METPTSKLEHILSGITSDKIIVNVIVGTSIQSLYDFKPKGKLDEEIPYSIGKYKGIGIYIDPYFHSNDLNIRYDDKIITDLSESEFGFNINNLI